MNDRVGHRRSSQHQRSLTTHRGAERLNRSGARFSGNRPQFFAACDCCKGPRSDAALSRLKQGFDSPRERQRHSEALIIQEHPANLGFVCSLVVALGGSNDACADGCNQGQTRNLLCPTKGACAPAGCRCAGPWQWQISTGLSQEVAWHQRPQSREHTRASPCSQSSIGSFGMPRRLQQKRPIASNAQQSECR